MTDYPGGYTGRILRINLNDRRIVKEELDISLINKFIGGRGLNGKFLYDEVKPGTDPLGPNNKVILGIGPCAGTLTPGSQRFTVTSKSPLTGFFGDSNSGGDLGAELKYAGYDMIILEGQSDVPVYLFINDEKVELRQASHLWGKTTSEARRSIEKEINDPEACLAVIGPAGENLVRFACIISELGRAAGRTGIGAVLGSKKVKAIAVRGSGGVKVANYKMLRELCKKNDEAWRGKDSAVYQNFAKYGPTSATKLYDTLGMHGTRNHREGKALKPLFHEGLEEYFVKQKSCFSCPIGCNHSFVIKNGLYTGTYGEGVEAAQLGEFGPRIGNDNLAVALTIGSLCDEYGIDVSDMGSTIAFTMECYERGILTKDDVDGLQMDWGDAEGAIQLIKMTAYRRGIGSILSQGVKRASEAIGKGSEKYAMHVKGQSFIGRNVRACKGWGLGFAVNNRGADHMRFASPEGAPIEAYDMSVRKLLEKYNDPTNPYLEEGKAEIVKWYEDLRAFEDCLEICRFSLRHAGWSLPEAHTTFYNSVTGNNITSDDVLHIGERIVNLERAFNIREGLTRRDDCLPERMTKEPLPDGPGAGQVIKLEPMLDEYYEFRGWDKSTSFPNREKLVELDLVDVSDELARMGKQIR
jgi:aldehyde:ferredoxin oxidoreductase